MSQRQPNSLRSLICRIDVTAFAAVMFALVAMFLAPAAVVDVQTWKPVDYAKVSHPIAMQAALREDSLEVAVTRDGKVYMGRDQITLDQLPTAIRDGVNRGAERKVYIRADGRARYGVVTQVMESARSAGIENIAFLVDQRKVPTE
jgi:biopolymer transport protein TolR